jgi:ABC-type glycerol-3-phosphate transport system substrate-binding protein
VRATTRRQFLLASLAMGGTIALVACGSAQTSGQAASGLTPGRAGGAPRWGMTAGQESAWQQIEAAADKEGAVTYYGQGISTPSEVPLFTDAWKKAYPNIKIDLVNGTTADVQTRISTEQDAKSYVGDVGDISVRSGLLEAKRGYSQKFIPPAAIDPTVKWSAERVYGDGDVLSDHMT